MEIIFRKINEAERDQLIELNKQLIVNDYPLPTEDIVESKWQELLSDNKLHCLVADNDGKLIASCILVIIPNLTRGTRPYGLIENVVTDEKFRNQGIGRKLLNYALEIAWKQDCYKVMLLTGRKDDATLRFYEKSGFIGGIKTGFIAYPE